MEMQVWSSGKDWARGITERCQYIGGIYSHYKNTLNHTTNLELPIIHTVKEKEKQLLVSKNLSSNPTLRFICYMTLGQVTPNVLNLSFSIYAVVIIIYSSIIIKCMRSP